MNQYDHIRKNLKEYTVPVDKDKLWAHTAHAIPQKRKKRGAFFLLLGGALLISSAATFYALSNSENNITSITEIQPTSNPKASIPSNETINLTDPAATGSTMTTTSVRESNHEQVSNAKTNTQNSNPQASTIIKTISPNRSSATKSIISSQSTGDVDAKSIIEERKDQAVLTEAIALASLGEADMSIIETVSNQSLAANTPEPFIQERIPETRNENYFMKDIPNIPLSGLEILSREISTPEMVATRTKNKNRFNLLLMQGYGWTTMDMNATNPELNTVVNAWEGKIKSLENLSTSLHALIRLPKGMQLSSGLQYSKLITQMEYLWTTEEDFIEEGTTAIIIDENGNHQNLIGDVEVHRETQVLSTRYSSQTRLDLELMLHVPLIRSYRMETGVWIKGGYNLLYASSGTTFTANDQLLKYTNDENPYSLPSPFTFGAGIGTLYRLSPQWTLNARLGYERLRYTHGLFDHDIQFAHNIFSLSLGTGYTF